MPFYFTITSFFEEFFLTWENVRRGSFDITRIVSKYELKIFRVHLYLGFFFDCNYKRRIKCKIDL